MYTRNLSICTCLQAGTVSLEAVMGHLSPSDEALAAAAKDAAAALAREIRGIGVISLSVTAAEPVRHLSTGETCRCHHVAC